MKRLTEYTIPETGFFVVSEEKYKRIMMEEKPSVEKVYNRLKKIEDILGDEYDLNLVQQLIQAYKEGRYIIMKEPEQAGVSRLRELSQADREVRHGRWMVTDGYPHRLYCSVCYKTYAKNVKWIEELDLPVNYCPECGALMDGKEDEHEVS